MNVRRERLMADRPEIHPGGGGSIPTSRLRRGEWEVRKCPLEIARSLTEQFHYSAGGSNTRVLTCGLWRKTEYMHADCAGASWWIPPTKSAGASIEPSNPQGVLSLSRVVIVPDTPKNAASFLIRHSMRFIDRERWPVLVTYADEWQGHKGGIYHALRDAGWVEDGWTKPEPTFVKDGVMVSRKAGPKTRTRSEMLAIGCVCVGTFRRRRFVNRMA